MARSTWNPKAGSRPGDGTRSRDLTPSSLQPPPRSEDGSKGRGRVLRRGQVRRTKPGTQRSSFLTCIERLARSHGAAGGPGRPALLGGRTSDRATRGAPSPFGTGVWRRNGSELHVEPRHGLETTRRGASPRTPRRRSASRPAPSRSDRTPVAVVTRRRRRTERSRPRSELRTDSREPVAQTGGQVGAREPASFMKRQAGSRAGVPPAGARTDRAVSAGPGRGSLHVEHTSGLHAHPIVPRTRRGCPSPLDTGSARRPDVSETTVSREHRPRSQGTVSEPGAEQLRVEDSGRERGQDRGTRTETRPRQVTPGEVEKGRVISLGHLEHVAVPGGATCPPVGPVPHPR